MTPILPYTGLIKDGKLFIDRSEHLVGEVVAEFGEGPVQLVLSKMHPTRTSSMNRYYWGIVLTHLLIALYDLGNDVDPENEQHKEWLHHILKEHYLGPGKWVSIKGKTRYVPPSTARLPTDKWYRYIDRIRVDAVDIMDYSIPGPDRPL